jgi:hypothetical protein
MAKPCQRDLGWRGGMTCRDLAENRIGGHTTKATCSAKRAIRDQLDPVLDAVAHDAVQEVLVVPHAQLHLHRRNRGDAPRLLDLTDIHVAQTHALDEPFVLQHGERPHAGGEGRSRVHGMQLIQVDPFDVERPQARFTGGAQVTRFPVRHPLAVWPCQTAFGGDDDAGAVAGPQVQRACDEVLVVTDVGIVPAVGVGRIEKRDTLVERGTQHLDAARLVALATSLVAVAFGREPHAADPDSGVFWVRRHEQRASSGQRSE